MLLSELIVELQKAKERHGDLPIFHCDDYDPFMVDDVTYHAEYRDRTVTEPAHILLGKQLNGSGKNLDSWWDDYIQFCEEQEFVGEP